MVYYTKIRNIQQGNISINHNGASLETLHKNIFAFAEVFSIRQKLYMEICSSTIWLTSAFILAEAQ